MFSQVLQGCQGDDPGLTAGSKPQLASYKKNQQKYKG